MYSQKDIARAYVGGNKSYTSATAVSGMAAGEIAVQKIDGSIITSGSSLTTEFRIVTMYADGAKYGDWINPVGVTYHTKSYLAAAEQISYLGYNTSSGDMDALASTEYIVRLLIKDNLKMVGNKQMYKYGAYKSNSTSSQEDVAMGLNESLVANFKRDPGVIKCEVVSNGTITELTMNLTVVNGSVTMTATAHSLTADTLIDVRGITYRVATVVDANNFTVNYAYQGISETIDVSATVDLCGTLATATKFGIKFTGIANTFTAGTFKYMKTRFDVLPEGFETAEVTNATLATEGVGTPSEVEELEWFLSGNDTDGLILGTPPTPRTTHVDSGATYQYTTIDFSDKSKDGIQGTPASNKQVILAFYVGGGQAATINTMLGTI